MASQEDDNKLEYISNVNKEQERYNLNVYKKFDSILNDKSEKFENKVQSLIEVWKSISLLNFSQFDIKYIIQILDWAKLHALNIVLTGEWTSIKESFRNGLLDCIQKAQESLVRVNDAFLTRCQKLADVVKKPWGDPVLCNLIQDRDAEIGSKEIEFFCVETAYLVSVRLKKLCEDHCEDLALNLVTNFLKCKKQATEQNFNLNAAETQLWFIFDIYIALLYKFHNKAKIIEQFEDLQLHEGVQLIKRFAKKRVKISKIWRHCNKIAIFGSRFFLSKALMKYNSDLKDSLTELVKTYLSLSNTESLLQEFVESTRNLTNLADAEGLCAMCDIIHREAGERLRHFTIEMYIRALTTDMNELERLKHVKEEEKVKLTTARLARSFSNLAELLNNHVKVARECILTAFSLEPTKDRLDQIVEFAKQSGFPVLDTGQQWKCRLHPPILSTDELAWICPDCGEWMCKPHLTASLQMNTPLQEALQESVLGISEALCDDLVVCVSNPRYQILNWLLSWEDLYRLCILYLNDPEKTKNFVTELKFVDVDYAMFDHIKREPVDEFSGIEKGYEQYLDLDFVSDEGNSTVSEDSSSNLDRPVNDLLSDGSGEPYLSLMQPKSDPNTLKSLRMFRPNLKRKKDGSVLQSKTKKQQPGCSYLPEIAKITPPSNYPPAATTPNTIVQPLNSVFNSTNLSSVTSTSYVSNIIKSSLTFGVPKVTLSSPNKDDHGHSLSTKVKKVYKSPTKINKCQTTIKNPPQDLDALLKEVVEDIDTEFAETKDESKNGAAATLPQLGGQVADNPSVIQVQPQVKLLPETSLLNGTSEEYVMNTMQCNHEPGSIHVKNLKVILTPIDMRKFQAETQHQSLKEITVVLTRLKPQEITTQSPIPAEVSISRLPQEPAVTCKELQVCLKNIPQDIPLIAQNSTLHQQQETVIPQPNQQITEIRNNFETIQEQPRHIITPQQNPTSQLHLDNSIVVPLEKQGQIIHTLPPKATIFNSPMEQENIGILNNNLQQPKIRTKILFPKFTVTAPKTASCDRDNFNVNSITKTDKVEPTTEVSNVRKHGNNIVNITEDCDIDGEIAEVCDNEKSSLQQWLETCNITKDTYVYSTTGSPCPISNNSLLTRPLSAIYEDNSNVPANEESDSTSFFQAKSNTNKNLENLKTRISNLIEKGIEDKSLGLEDNVTSEDLAKFKEQLKTFKSSSIDSKDILLGSQGCEEFPFDDLNFNQEVIINELGIQNGTEEELISDNSKHSSETTKSSDIVEIIPSRTTNELGIQNETEEELVSDDSKSNSETTKSLSDTIEIIPSKTINEFGIQNETEKELVSDNSTPNLETTISFSDVVDIIPSKSINELGIQNETEKELVSDDLKSNSETTKSFSDMVELIPSRTINEFGIQNETEKELVSDNSTPNLETTKSFSDVVDIIPSKTINELGIQNETEKELVSDDLKSNSETTKSFSDMVEIIPSRTINEFGIQNETEKELVSDNSTPNLETTKSFSDVVDIIPSKTINELGIQNETEKELVSDDLKSNSETTKSFSDMVEIIPSRTSDFLLKNRETRNYHNYCHSFSEIQEENEKHDIFLSKFTHSNKENIANSDNEPEMYFEKNKDCRKYSNSRKRKHDDVPCFKLDQEKEFKRRLTIYLKRLPEIITRPNVKVILNNSIKNHEKLEKQKIEKLSPLTVSNKRDPIKQKKKLEETKNKGVNINIYEDKFYSMVTKSPVNIPGLHDYSEILPKHVKYVVNVVQHSVPRSSTVPNQNTQTSTQVTPHIQRIGQPKIVDRKPDAEQTPSNSSVPSTSVSQPSTLINILSSPKTKSGPTRAPYVNILSQQILRPSIRPIDHQTATVIKVEPEEKKVEVQATKTVNTNLRIVTTTTQAGGQATVSSPAQGGTILQFICKSSSLPKFQQAFGKTVYQTEMPAQTTASSETNETNSQPQMATVVEAKKVAAAKLPVNVQPIAGNVIFRGQVPVGQTVSLIPPGSNTRQLFRITGSTHEQISLVKETVIQNKMSALLAAALQGKPKITEQNGEVVEEYSATRITLCRPGAAPPNATRIVKPMQLQIPANVIRAPQPNVSSTTLEQLREFDLVYEQVKERSSAQPESTTQNIQESAQQQRISFTYVNQVQKYTQLAPVVVVSSYSPIQQISPAIATQSGAAITQVSTVTVPKVAVKACKGKTIKNTVVKTSPTTVPPVAKPQQKPQEDEHTTQRIFDILAEYAEQLRNSPDLNNKPAPRRRSNPPTNPNSNTSVSTKKKKKKSSNSSLVETDNEDLTMGSEDSSNGNVVQLSMTDEEQSQNANITPPETNMEPTTSQAPVSAARPLIVTEASPPRNVIIADSSVGEALKMPSTTLIMPGNYLMPVSVVKGGQQIAVVSGGSKILTTVPTRTGQNMLLFQSFVNQKKGASIPAVKYSTLQPFSAISAQSVTTVNAQSPVVLPSTSVATVALGQPIALKKIEENNRVNNTELLLTIAQPREAVKVEKTPEIPQPDSSTTCEEIKREPSKSNEVYDNVQKNCVVTSVIASVIKKENERIEQHPREPSAKKDIPKANDRIDSVLVNASSSNGPMLSHTNPRYNRKSTDEGEPTSANRNIAKVPATATKIFKNNAVYYAIRTKKSISKKVDSEIHKQAAIERELRLQKSLSEECEDLGVDEPSTSDLFPEADLLFDSNHSPSYEQKMQAPEAKAKDLHLFTDDENSGPLNSDLFDYVEYHPQESGVNGNNVSKNDSTLLQNCGNMSEVTLNSPISPDYNDSSHTPNKYKYKYSNRKKGEKVIKQQSNENWQEMSEVTSSEDAMEVVKEEETPIAIQEETVIDEPRMEIEEIVVEEERIDECPIHGTKNVRRNFKMNCLCFNGSRGPRKRMHSPKNQTAMQNKKVILSKKR
ncbi:hypothetical protein ABEB36_011174 [Hypothenemus hampei]|uniref:Zinc finger protein Rlf/292/654 TPR repeats domain-containing protein n=1 Tax=Hypothenemus hampei TaxID=57062 RepID=A0ABD1EEF7_HYPHA